MQCTFAGNVLGQLARYTLKLTGMTMITGFVGKSGGKALPLHPTGRSWATYTMTITIWQEVEMELDKAKYRVIAWKHEKMTGPYGPAGGTR